MFHAVMVDSVSYCHGCQCFLLSYEFQGFILSWVPMFHTDMAVSVSYCHG